MSTSNHDFLVKNILKASLCIVGVVITNDQLSIPASASAYLRHFINEPGLKGSKFRSINSQENLIAPGPNVSAASRDKFIAKQTWLLAPAANGKSEWVEVGTVKGWTSPNGGITGTSYWAGHYYARQKVVNGLEVYSRVYGGSSSNPPTGPQNYQVSYAGLVNGTNYWNFYVNGNLIGSIDHSRSNFSQMQIGVESNNTCTSFTSGTSSQYIQKLGNSASWTDWTFLSVGGNAANAYSTWSSSYSPAGNAVTFVRSSNPSSCP